MKKIENAIAEINSAGAEAFRGGKHPSVQELASKAQQMTEFRSKVNALRKEWLSIAVGLPPAHVETTPLAPSRTPTKSGQRKVYQRLQKGLRTPQEEFRVPILQALVELGGAAPMEKVLVSVAERMKHRLNAHDLKPLASDPKKKQLRWRTSAQFERYEMVKEGLLSSESDRGIWEITAAGRQWLATQTAQK